MHYPSWPGMAIDNRSRGHELEWSSAERFRVQSLPQNKRSSLCGVGSVCHDSSRILN